MAHFIFLNHLFQIISLAPYTLLCGHTQTRAHIHTHTHTCAHRKRYQKISEGKQELCNQITSEVMVGINKIHFASIAWHFSGDGLTFGPHTYANGKANSRD